MSVFCKACSLWKSETEYHKDKQRSNGLKFYCKECTKAKCLEYSHSEQGKEKRSSYNKQWSVRNADRKSASYKGRQAAKLKAMPGWADKESIVRVYSEAKDLTERTGIRHEVDHIVPLRSNLVCGLHVENNLQVLSYTENRIKGNRFWPDCP